MGAVEKLPTAAANASSDSKRLDRLLWYVLGVATLAFTGRAAPLAFLPLVVGLPFQFGKKNYLTNLCMAPLLFDDFPKSPTSNPTASQEGKGLSGLAFRACPC